MEVETQVVENQVVALIINNLDRDTAEKARLLRALWDKTLCLELAPDLRNLVEQSVDTQSVDTHSVETLLHTLLHVCPNLPHPPESLKASVKASKQHYVGMIVGKRGIAFFV